ncbi:MAG: alpha-amylase family glycosyl hydrolase [Bacteroidales bacterium]|nr:alpha-amylase family glycosyl hydrolase [Bacteroidales bacterium]MCM1417049.1 alpha-amylase family glycosyl hydrolase [bacterium]MCM1423247.1 alpha-amylase family glycosyl hydrolase [bacterium]
MNNAQKRAMAGILSAALLCGCGMQGENIPLQNTLGEESPEPAGEQAAEAGEPSENDNDSAAKSVSEEAAAAGREPWEDLPLQMIDDNYRTYYEVFVYSFCDSDGDGVGDLQGLISKLDYINDGDDATDTDLGCNGIWLMPVNPSPTYHKYDVADYYAIDEEYGTLEDFQGFLAACDERGIKVIMDLVLNHSSSQNPWFQDACAYLRDLSGAEPNAADCPYYNYYHFSKEQGGGWYPVEGTDWYYEAQFWSEMPDLNLDCEALRMEIAGITKYWLDMGVGGFRLDAVKEYYSGAPQANIDFLSWLTETVKSQKADAYLVGEAWLDQADYAKYYESGIDSIFDFAFADKDGIISKALNGGSAAKYGETIASLEETYGAYNENYIDAPFYTNHDMGRSAGYYAGEESAAQTKLAGAMNLFMSGSAFLYYGEELGMKGSGKDENKRAPMYWSMDPDAAGMCDGPADMETVKMKFESLEEQEQDASSVYAFYKKVIKIRNQNPEIARGTAEYVLAGDLAAEEVKESVCAIKKTYDGSEILLLFVTGAEAQELDLTGITLNGAEIGAQTQVRGALATGEDAVRFEEGKAVMPGYSALVLK